MESSFYFWSSLLALTISLVVHLLTCQAIPTGQSIPDTFDYRKFLSKHHKIYLSHTEGINRAKIFYQRTLDIFKVNVLYAAHLKSYFLNQNWFTDTLPKDVESIRAGKMNDLVPVKEAHLSPDTPADQFLIEDGELGESKLDLDDPVTKSSRSDLTANEERHEKPVVKFFTDLGEDANIEPAKLYRELKRKPGLAARMSKFINLHFRGNNAYLNRLMKIANNIIHEDVVEPTNKDFDINLVKSQGVKSNSWGGLHADLMMDDFLGLIEAPDGSTFDYYDQNTNFLSGFVGAVKTFADLFAIYDEADKLLSRDQKPEPKKETKTDPPKSPRSLRRVPSKTGTRYHIDWRQTGCVPRVKNQLLCNACYAFTTMDIMEYFYCREKNVRTEFSAQYLVDCGTRVGLNGCVGGKYTDIKTFILEYGLQSNRFYPYTGNQETCPYHESEKDKISPIKPKIIRWSPFTEYQAWKTWIASSPVIVGINMPADFLSYGGGIHDGLDCIEGMPHALLLVGAGSEDGHPFWLLKNTFSEDWGENGYFRLSRRAPIKCFLAAIITRVTFEPSPESESEPQSEVSPQSEPNSEPKSQPEPKKEEEPKPQPEQKPQSPNGTRVRKGFWQSLKSLENFDHHHLSA